VAINSNSFIADQLSYDADEEHQLFLQFFANVQRIPEQLDASFHNARPWWWSPHYVLPQRSWWDGQNVSLSDAMSQTSFASQNCTVRCLQWNRCFITAGQPDRSFHFLNPNRLSLCRIILQHFEVGSACWLAACHKPNYMGRSFDGKSFHLPGSRSHNARPM